MKDGGMNVSHQQYHYGKNEWNTFSTPEVDRKLVKNTENISPILEVNEASQRYFRDMAFSIDDAKLPDNTSRVSDSLRHFNPTNDDLSESLSISDSNDSEAVSKDFMYFLCLPVRQIAVSVSSLEGSPRELYINLIIKFLDSYGYFCLSQVFVILMHDEFDCSDVLSGVLYGVWASAAFFWSLATFWINDNLGVRKSLLIGYCISLVSMLLLIFSNSLIALFAVVLVISPLSFSIGPPMLLVGIKRYTTEANRSFAFGLSYSAMNAAAFCSGLAVDLFNLTLRDTSISLQVYLVGREVLSPTRLLLVSAAVAYLVAFAVTFRFVREIQVRFSGSSWRRC